MSENKFRENEIARIRGKEYPLLAGRIRLAVEAGQVITVRSELLRFEPGELAVTKVTVETTKGSVQAHGVASVERDPEFVGSLAELSESRAWSRALRWGFGSDVGYEELGNEPMLDGDLPKPELRVAKASSHPRADGNGSGHQPQATGAQRRAILAMARAAGRDADDLIHAVYPRATLDDLTLGMASSVIQRVRDGANGNGRGASGR